MKRAKILLSAVATLAIVAGALAFKAQRFNNHKLYWPNPVTTSICDQEKIGVKLTDLNHGAAADVTDVSGQPCVNQHTTTVNDTP